jgi:hypothetical protein
MRLPATLSLLAMACAAPAVAAAKSCPIERTVYRLNGFETSATLRFVNDPAMARQSHLSGVLTSSTTGRTYRYYIAVSNGYSTHYLIDANRKKPQHESDDGQSKAENEAASFAFYSFDKGLHAVNLPNPGERAPAFVFIPEIGSVLWYSEPAPGQKNRESIETEMWKPAECVKQA